MAVDIILKKGRGVPPAESLSLGELAIDDATGIVYTLLVSGEVVPVNQAAIDSKAVLDISDSAPLGVDDGYLWLNSLNGLVYIYDSDAGWFEFPNSGSSTGGGDGIPEAPMEGGPYGRQTGSWVELTGGDGTVDLTGYATETWVTEQGYLTEFTETDPTVPDHVKAITEQDIATWNAGGSGVAGVTTFNNRSGNVVLTAEDVEAVYSYTETDPTVPQHVKDITQADIDKWNSGTGGGSSLWTEESDGSISRNSVVRVKSNITGYYTDFKNGQGIEQISPDGTRNSSAYRILFNGQPTLQISNSGDYTAPSADVNINTLTANNEIISIGAVHANAFKKSGGTASQLLCADGSVVDKDSVGGGGGGGNDPRITDTQITNWDEAHGWGDHSTVGYLTSVDLNGYATEVWVENQNYLTSADLNGYATQTWVNNQGYLVSADLNGYATQTWVNNQGYLTSYSETDPTVPQHVKNITQTDINNWNAGSSVDLSGYATESWVSSNYQTKGSYLVSSDLNGYATQTWVNNQGFAKGTIPTNNNQLTNGAGYVTSNHEHPASKITTGTFKSGTYRFPGAVTAVGDITAYYSSDERLKKDLEPLEGMAAVSKLRGYRFHWDDEKCEELEMEQRGKDVGVVAQEVIEVLPEVCVVRDNGYIGVRYDKLVPTLIQAINELQAQIDELKGSK